MAKDAWKGSSVLSRSASVRHTCSVGKLWSNWVLSTKRVEPLALVGGRVQRRLALEALGRTKLLQQGRDGQLAAMYAGLVGVAELDAKLARVERDEFGHAR